MYADLSLENKGLKAIIEKNRLGPPERRDLVKELVAEHRLSITRACRAMKLSRTAFYRPLSNWLERDRDVVEALSKITSEHHRWGFWMCYDVLRGQGYLWNHRRVRRVYRAMGLNLKRRGKRRLPVRFRQSLDTPPIPNYIWAMDFMEDRLYVGRRFRTLNILDEGVREAVHIEIDTSLPGERIVRVMEQLKESRELPAAIRCDNRQELTSQVFTYREEILSSYLFEDLDQVREITHWWLITYNEQRPHDALNGLTPAAFRTKTEAELSTFDQ
jgi:putative transposase